MRPRGERSSRREEEKEEKVGRQNQNRTREEWESRAREEWERCRNGILACHIYLVTLLSAHSGNEFWVWG